MCTATYSHYQSVFEFVIASSAFLAEIITSSIIIYLLITILTWTSLYNSEDINSY